MDRDEERDRFLGSTVGGKFVIHEPIGSGSMGMVYRAEQINLGRTVAVKIMHRHLLVDETAAIRFQTEARATSQINHPHSISVIDFGWEGPDLYIVLEYLQGRGLDRVLAEEGLLPIGMGADILCQAMEAVHAAHELNIIHRDLKPENLFLEQVSGRYFVKVMDFGIAKIIGPESRALTAPGVIMGSPKYMSPEQINGEELDLRSDIYSLGVILYQLLTGTVPFQGSAMAVMLGHQEPPEPPSKRSPDRKIPTALEAVVLKALAKSREARFATADQFREHLSKWAAQ